jgi:hypothetical protein
MDFWKRTLAMEWKGDLMFIIIRNKLLLDETG